MMRSLRAILPVVAAVVAIAAGCATTRTPANALLRFGAADATATSTAYTCSLSFGLGKLEFTGTSRDLEGKLVVVWVQIAYTEPADGAVPPELEPDAVALTLGGVAPIDTWATVVLRQRETDRPRTGHRFVFRRTVLDSAAAAGGGLEGTLSLAGYAHLGTRLLDLPAIRVVPTDPSLHPRSQQTNPLPTAR